MSELTDRQIQFCENYLADPNNKTDAARRAGYLDPDKMSRYLLAHEDIKAYISRRQEEISKRLGISPESVLRELAGIAYFRLADFVDLDLEGNPQINIQKLKASPAASVVTEFAVTKRPGGVTTVKVKQADKVAALLQIAKHLGMLTEKVEVSGKLDFLKLIEDSFLTIEQPKPVLIEEAEFEEIPIE